MIIEDHLPALQIVLPLLGSVFAALVRRGAPAWIITLAVSWSMPFIAFAMLLKVQASGPFTYALGGWEAPYGIEYRVDIVNAYLLVLVSILAALVITYAPRSIAAEIDEDKRGWTYSLYLLCLTGLLGILITGDAFNVFVFLEISSLATYGLIAMGKDKRALVAAFQYLIVGTIGATFYVIGVGLILAMTGTLNFTDIAERLPEIAHTRPIIAALAFITVGICLKLALFPLHSWLPNAYAYAPSMATAFLASTATKVAIYLLLRYFFSIFGAENVFTKTPIAEIFLVLSVAAMFGASIVAVFQSDVKRLLAYSSVAQIGYITLGIALANKTGLTGGIVHLFNHAMIKGALFLAVGCIVYRVGTVKIEELAGIGRKMPWTMAAFVIAGLGLIGVPGTAGFVSKWYLVAGALENGWWWMAFAIVASSLIAVLYIGRLVEIAYFREPTKAVADGATPPAEMIAVTWVLTAATVYFGLDADLTAGIAQQAAENLLAGVN